MQHVLHCTQKIFLETNMLGRIVLDGQFACKILPAPPFSCVWMALFHETQTWDLLCARRNFLCPLSSILKSLTLQFTAISISFYSKFYKITTSALGYNETLENDRHRPAHLASGRWRKVCKLQESLSQSQEILWRYSLPSSSSHGEPCVVWDLWLLRCHCEFLYCKWEWISSVAYRAITRISA